MKRGFNTWTILMLCPLVAAPLACSGDDGKQGPPGPVTLNASTMSNDMLEELEVVSTIESVTIKSPPKVTFSLKTDKDVPIIGIVPFWNESSRFVRFTLTKLVAGANGDPDSWVAYVRDGGEPDYDTGSSLVDNQDGTYTFTFNTDVTTVAGVPFEPGATHRLAGQIGSRSVGLAAQNLVHDFVPNGAAVTHRRDIATMESCNECHDDLVFHGRRFEVEYCVQCHNPDLAGGEGDLGFMIHRIHASGTFATLDGGVDYSEVTYPQDLANCRKCHNADDLDTPQANNWQTLPNIQACDGCHAVFETDTHSGPSLTTNDACMLCHGPGMAEEVAANHLTPNATPNNPNLLMGQRNITYELIEATVDGSNEVTIEFQILSDGTPLDILNLPADLVDPMTMLAHRYPSFLLAYAMPQDGIDEPGDYNNMGQRAGQPIGVGLDDFMPIEMGAPVGLLSFNAMDGVMTATITDAASQFPMGATLRAVGLQSYLQQDLDADGADDVSLHTPSAVVAVTGDDSRRLVVDNESCASCHESFEGHGGNRVYNMAICTMCHVPNLSSSGRTVTDTTARSLDVDLAAAVMAGSLSAMVDPDDALTYPESAQNFKDLVHGIHSSGFRTKPFQHVRGPSRQGYYDWSHVTFPRDASTSNCSLCHLDGTYELPLADDVLATTVRTTGEDDGMDLDVPAAEAAFVGVSNDSDWVNSPTASSCFFCHTSTPARAHMALNGGLLSEPDVADGVYANRMLIGTTFESCSVCHGPGKSADVEAVHNR